ncbi:MAG: ChrR family anti-sigma-E factor [Rhizomicrobium sp.]
MTITHHPGEELLLSYALGASSEPVALLIATHLSACATCRAAVSGMEAAGGAMFARVAPAAMSDRGLQSVLSRLDVKSPEREQGPVVQSDVPSPLRVYIGDDFAKARWVPIAPGLAHLPLMTRGGARARLIRARPGAGVAVHTHRGEEWTMVLTGSYHDETGQYLPGDVQTTTPQVLHQPVADDGPVCINLAVTDAPLIFKGLLPKIVGKVFGF